MQKVAKAFKLFWPPSVFSAATIYVLYIIPNTGRKIKTPPQIHQSIALHILFITLSPLFYYLPGRLMVLWHTQTGLSIEIWKNSEKFCKVIPLRMTTKYPCFAKNQAASKLYYHTNGKRRHLNRSHGTETNAKKTARYSHKGYLSLFIFRSQTIMKNTIRNSKKKWTVFYIRFLDSTFFSLPIHLNYYFITQRDVMFIRTFWNPCSFQGLLTIYYIITCFLNKIHIFLVLIMNIANVSNIGLTQNRISLLIWFWRWNETTSLIPS